MIRNLHEEVKSRLLQGCPQRKIALDLGVSTGTVAYHAKKIRLGESVAPRKLVNWREIQDYVDRLGLRKFEVMKAFGVSNQGILDAIRRGDLKLQERPVPSLDQLEDSLTGSRSTQASRRKLRKALIAEGVEYRCSECGIDEWRGYPITLALDHINGDSRDNFRENLRFLCPNCHSQTETYGGRNKTKYQRV